jgi:hypothetical protein
VFPLDPKAIKEWGEMYVEPEKPFPFVRFGSEVHEVTAISAAAWSAKHKGTARPEAALFWTSTLSDGSKVTLARKKDHNLLVCMYVQKPDEKSKRMVCMMSVKSWGPVDEVS